MCPLGSSTALNFPRRLSPLQWCRDFAIIDYQGGRLCLRWTFIQPYAEIPFQHCDNPMYSSSIIWNNNYFSLKIGCEDNQTFPRTNSWVAVSVCFFPILLFVSLELQAVQSWSLWVCRSDGKIRYWGKQKMGKLRMKLKNLAVYNQCLRGKAQPTSGLGYHFRAHRVGREFRCVANRLLSSMPLRQSKVPNKSMWSSGGPWTFSRNLSQS